MKKILSLTSGSCKLHVIVAIWILLPVFSNGQPVSVIGKTDENYKIIFGTKYSEAFAYLTTNYWITDTLKFYQVDPAFAAAIIFPELIRYSSIRDKIEIGGLFGLYVQFGQKYADFSVGHFQMKPTFAWQLEYDMSKIQRHPEFTHFAFDITETSKARLERVKRLDSPLWQIRYLAIFIKVMDAKYALKAWSSTVEKLKFYATAYNSGYTGKFEEIAKRIDHSSFYVSVMKSKVCYSYAAIAEDFFQSCSNRMK